MKKTIDIYSDRSMVFRLMEGDEHAFTALYDRYVSMVYNYVSSMLKDATLAKDITQFCFMQMWEHRRTLDPDRNVAAWLYVTARNMVYKETRRQVVAAKYIDFAVQTSEECCDADSGKSIDIRMINDEIDKVVEAMPDSRRRIFLMKTEREMSVREIAEELEISPKTVETQLSRSLAAIRKHISKIMAFSLVLGAAFRF